MCIHSMSQVYRKKTGETVCKSGQFHIHAILALYFALQKVELRKVEVAWKRAAEAAKELTEEEQETQVIRHHNTDYPFVL